MFSSRHSGSGRRIRTRDEPYKWRPHGSHRTGHSYACGVGNHTTFCTCRSLHGPRGTSGSKRADERRLWWGDRRRSVEPGWRRSGPTQVRRIWHGRPHLGRCAGLEGRCRWWKRRRRAVIWPLVSVWPTASSFFSPWEDKICVYTVCNRTDHNNWTHNVKSDILWIANLCALTSITDDPLMNALQKL